MDNIFSLIAFVIIYGSLSFIALIIFLVIKKTKWNPWFRTLAFLPFLAFWIITYEPADAIYHYAFEEVTGEKIPEDFRIIEKSHSSCDEFGDYFAFAVFEVDATTHQKVNKKFKFKAHENKILSDKPQSVEEYFKAHPEKNIQNSYHFRDEGGVELYGTTFSDRKTVLVYRWSW